MNKKQKTINKKLQFFALCSLLFALLPLLWNLLRPGFYTSHDGEWMVIRLSAFHDALRQSQFPVRFLPRLNHGYGYPVTNFLYPLPFYLSEPVYLLTGDPSTAVQAVMGLSIVAMAIGMYVLLSHLGVVAASVGSLVYAYSPYVAYNLYQRGSLGEVVAMGIAPWVFWAVKKRFYPLASLLLALLILSHNVVAVLFVPVVLLYCIYKLVKKPLLLTPYSLLLTLAFGTSAFFWFPALSELQFVRVSTISVSDFANEYLSPLEAYRRSGPISTVLLGGLPVYLLTERSRWFWESLRFLQVIQFPWRILSVCAFLGAVMSGFLIERLRRTWIQLLIGLLILFIVFISSLGYLTPSSFINRPADYYKTNDDSTTVRAEYTPIWVQDLPTKRPDTPLVHYYPGWRAFLRGHEIQIENPWKTNGVIKTTIFALDPLFIWGETPSRLVADTVSVGSVLLILVWFKKQEQYDEASKRHGI